ncbi:VanZ family protein [Pseudonocardia spinosispora]|uniref:VanZ family protein n=1 Tax=Pseudonocardia spinosispora TaxID=103441 RepID=UPI00041243E9|nr:VanZ family protein [Pseudonocardia spinosispora]
MVTIFEAAHHLRRVVPISKWTPIFLLVGLVVALLIWRPLARSLGWRSFPTLIALLSLAGASAMTLSPRGWYGNYKTLEQCLPSTLGDVADSASKVGGSMESLLNVGMLFPLGCALVVASRRAVWPALLVVLLPAAIEISQATVVPGRQCSTTDFLANALGGLIGIVAGVVIDRMWRARERQAEPVLTNS